MIDENEDWPDDDDVEVDTEEDGDELDLGDGGEETDDDELFS